MLPGTFDWELGMQTWSGPALVLVGELGKELGRGGIPHLSTPGPW